MKALFVAATAVAAFASLAIAAPASAQVTASVAYSGANVDDADFGAITGRVGWRSNWLGVEGEVSGGVKDDTVNVAGTNVKVDLKNQIAAYGVAYLPVAPNFDLFARVGYGQTRIDASAAGTTIAGTDHSWNYGAGGQYFFDANNGVRADYTRLDFDNSGVNADVWSVGYVRKF